MWKQKRRRISGYLPRFTIALLIIIIGGGCSKQHTSIEDELTHGKMLLDQGKYDNAVTYLADALSYTTNNVQATLPLPSPNYTDLAQLLAHAHLGAAGFKLLDFLNATIGQQDSSTLDLYVEPSCNPAPMSTWDTPDGMCFLYNAMKHFPDADNPHILAAKQLFRQYFPDPSQTASDVNFLSAFVEIGSALNRFKILYNRELVIQMQSALAGDLSTFPFEVTIHNLKNMFPEINHGILRMKWSYDQMSQLMSALNGLVILSYGGRTMEFNQTIQPSDFVRFAARIAQDQGTLMDSYLSYIATNRLNQLRSGWLLPAVQVANSGSYSAGVLNALADSMDISTSNKQQKVSITFFDLLWKDPPLIVNRLFVAAQEAWDTESGDPMRNYFAVTGSDWLELKALISDWNTWLNEDISPSANQTIVANITPPPMPLDLSNLNNLEAWATKTGSIFYAGTAPILKGQNSSASQLFIPEQIQQGISLMNRTNVWMDKDFYPVSDWVTIQ